MMKLKVTLVSLSLLFCQFAFAAPVVGSDAPDFKLADQHGKFHSLTDYKGQWVVLYFYPKDNTPGCTIEAGNFRDNLNTFKEKNAVVFGISVDNIESHLDFHNTLTLNFNLLADVDKNMSRSYEVLFDLGLVAYSKRQTFIVDPDGRIAHHFEDVDPDTHTQMVLDKLNELLEIYK